MSSCFNFFYKSVRLPQNFQKLDLTRFFQDATELLVWDFNKKKSVIQKSRTEQHCYDSKSKLTHSFQGLLYNIVYKPAGIQYFFACPSDV